MSLYIDSGTEDESDSEATAGSDMEVEPPKSTRDWFLEWINFYAGNGPNPLLRIEPPSQESIVTIEPTSRALREEHARRVMRERAIDEQLMKEAMRNIRLSKPVPYIGDQTMTERFLIFWNTVLKPGTKTINGTQVLERQAWSQSPYDDSTWRSLAQLALVNDPTKATHWDTVAVTKELFRRIYREVSHGLKLTTYSSPEIFLLRTQNTEVFKEILYGDNALLMKMTPFIDAQGRLIDERELQSIYNEIKIAFFLNELLYGYKHVLSVHFTVLVDWFQTSREKLALYKDPSEPSSMDSLYSQVTISEYAHTDLEDFIAESPRLGRLRAVLFQILHALETAWITNEFIHLDLHLGNIRMKRSEYATSPFYGRNLLYNRNGIPHWYSLSHRDLGEHIVKIIDFGFSRLYGPEWGNHRRFDKQANPSTHIHSKLIGLHWPAAGMIPSIPNRFADVRMLLVSLLALPNRIWHAMPLAEREEFYGFTEDILDFEEINSRISLVARANAERRIKAGGVLTPANLTDCPYCAEYLRIVGGYARVYTETGRTATDALDHHFFHSLRRKPQPNLEETDPEDVVVSFFTQTGEEEMATTLSSSSLSSSSSSHLLRCEVCKGKAEHVNLEGDVHIPLCGDLCAEFRYKFGEKTVFR